MDPSAVSRGSSLDRDDNGLLTLAGGKITDYRKMAEGAMERVVDILKAQMHRRSLHLLTAWNKRQVLAWQTPCPFTMQCAMS
ncbi:alpha-glycerophosphate oxidase [Streptococcus pneumoniae]|nr:alpha-glycerophosphate oxidase [Streptococcus pneumoniae]